MVVDEVECLINVNNFFNNVVFNFMCFSGLCEFFMIFLIERIIIF